MLLPDFYYLCAMKRMVSIVFLPLLAIVICTSCRQDEPAETQSVASLQQDASPALSAIDSLMWQQPDSALACIVAYFDTCCDTSDYNRHYAQLLLSELLYKNDYAQTNREELLRAVGYFDSLVRQLPPLQKGVGGFKDTPQPKRNLPFLAARAHYINGVGYYERDSVVEACKEYLKAIEVMEEGFEERELVGKKAKFMALTYTHLTSLFSDQYLHEQAIIFGRHALHFYNKHNATNWHVAWMLVEVGSQYDMLEQLDSAKSYYCQARQVLTDTSNLTYRDITAHQAFLIYKRDKQIEEALSKLHCLLSQAANNKEISARNLSIAEIYYCEKIFDSAEVYYNQVFHQTENVNSKILSAKRLQEIYGINGDTINSNHFALFLSQFVNAGDKQGKLHSQLTQLCKEYEQNRQESLHRQRERKDHLALTIVVGGLLASASIVMLLYFVSKKRSTRLMSEKAKAEKQLKTERQAYKTQQAALVGRLKKSNEALRDVSQQLENAMLSRNAALNKVEIQSNYSAFRGSPICKHILNTVEDCNFKPKVDCLIYKDYALDKKQLSALLEAADSHLGQITVRIQKKYPALTNDDMKYCCLYLLGLNEADISALMQRAYSTVCERNRKIKRVIGTEGELSAALMELL